MNSLPSSVNYAEVVASLPDNAIKYSVSLQPINGSSFGTGGQQIQFQFPNRGYFIPDSLYLRYKCVTTCSAATPVYMLGTPCYTPFQRLETQFGSVTVDSINNYNQVAHILTNCTLDVAQKYGMQSSYGYTGVLSVPTLEELDGRYIASAGGDTTSFSCPLPCLLTNVADKLLPLFAMPTITVTLTTDALTNMFSSNVATSLTLSNLELCFDFIELGSEVDAMVRGMGPKLYIKSQSFSNSSVSLASGISGSQSIVFNQRYASVKAAIVSFSSGAGYGSNQSFEALDITQNLGDYSITIGSIQYPQKPLSAVNNKSGILQELRRCIGSIYDKTNAMSINSGEFNIIDAGVFNTGFNAPGKFYLGFNLQKLHTNSLLTGISTNNSNISVNVNMPSATNKGHPANLLLIYDALIEISVLEKQSSVKT